MAETAWRALTAGPGRLLASGWPWRTTAYLLTGWLVAVTWAICVALLILVPAAGLLVLASGVPFGAAERLRLRLVDPTPAPSPHARPRRPGLWGWLSARLSTPVTWRELGYATVFTLGLAWLDAVPGLLVLSACYLVAFPVLGWLLPEYQPDRIFGLVPAGFPQSLLATVFGLALLPVVLYAATAYGAGRAAQTRRWLLGRPGDQAVTELTRSRARILEAMDAQRRRIERDLHDGAQQRLTGLVMTLGLARLRLSGDDAAGELVERAFEQARAALAELRDLVHGIHPRVLTDRGLGPALAELADRCPVPVDVRVDVPERPPEPVEAAAWFVIGEALTNVARHSGATRSTVECRRTGGVLVVEVTDDGIGGADPAAGTGLLGLADRISVLAGRLALDSPRGGPTRLRAELPCE